MTKQLAACLVALLAFGASRVGAAQNSMSVRTTLVNLSAHEVSGALLTDLPYSSITIGNTPSLRRSSAVYWLMPAMTPGSFTVRGVARTTVPGQPYVECLQTLDAGGNGFASVQGFSLLVSDSGSGLQCQIIPF